MIEENGQKLEKPLFESLLSAWVQEKKLRVDLPFVSEEKKKRSEEDEDGIVIAYTDTPNETDEELDKLKSRMVDVLLECDSNNLCYQILRFTCTQVESEIAGLYLCEGQNKQPQNVTLIAEYPTLDSFKCFSPFSFLISRSLSRNERLSVQDKNTKMSFVIQPLHTEYQKPIGAIVVGYQNDRYQDGMKQWPHHRAMAQMGMVSADFLVLKLQSFFLWKHLEDVFDDCSDLFTIPHP